MSNILIIKNSTHENIAQACDKNKHISENHKQDQIQILTTQDYFQLFKKNPEKFKYINNEHSILKDQLEKNVKSNDKLNTFFQSLKEINAKLWDIEDNKRQCEKDKDFGEKFIKLSRDVHFLNDDRAKIKLEINNHTGSVIKEIKEYTSY